MRKTQYNNLKTRHVKCLVFTVVISLGVINSCLSQNQEGKGKVLPTVGFTFRTTAMNFFNFDALSSSDMTRPYSYEKNVQGLSINLGLQYNLTNYLAIEYSPNLRNDIVYSEVNSWEFTGTIGPNGDSAFVSDDHTYKKFFLIDHNFNLIYRGNVSYGVGVSIINFNKEYEFSNPHPRKHDIEFTSYNAFAQFDLLQNTKLEAKVLYVPAGFPHNEQLRVLMYSLRLFYVFDFY